MSELNEHPQASYKYNETFLFKENKSYLKISFERIAFIFFIFFILAIIFSSKTEIKAEPNERSENLLNLHLGTKVKIIDSFNEEWVKIKLVNGQEGWINNKEIKII